MTSPQILYSMSLNVNWIYEKNNRSLLFSGSRKMSLNVKWIYEKNNRSLLFSGSRKMSLNVKWIYEKNNRSLLVSGSRKMSLNVKWIYEKNNRSLLFSGSRKIQTLGSTIQWETRQASFPTGMVSPWVGIFLSPLNTNDGFYISNIPVLARGKDRKRLSELRPHASYMWICDVIVMLKLRHHVAFSPRI